MSPVDPIVHHLLRLGGALLFGSVAAHKFRSPADFQSALAGYRLLPAGIVPVAARGLLWLELAVAVALVVPASARIGAAAGASLLVLYTGAIALNLIRGRREIDCGCAVSGGPRPLGGSLVVRNVVLIAGLVMLLAPVVPRELTRMDVGMIPLATGMLAILYSAIDQSLANSARKREAD
ncbi:MAG: methylamine utilization protein MauE [bacterium]|nr:methylamine utilization protein MauE [bacterium]MCP5067149.1 methylamine utilization protein MauE [bacterium]